MISTLSFLRFRLSPFGLSRYRSGLVIQPLLTGIPFVLCKYNRTTVLAEINPYHPPETVSSIAKTLIKNEETILKALSSSSFTAYDRLSLSLPSFVRSVFSQLFFKYLSLHQQVPLATLYSKYLSLTDHIPSNTLKVYASGGTFLSDHPFQKIDDQIQRASNIKAIGFKYRPPVPAQLSHHQRLAHPPSVHFSETSQIALWLKPLFQDLMVDFGCRLMSHELPLFRPFLQTLSFCEEPFARNSSLYSDALDDIYVAHGEHSISCTDLLSCHSLTNSPSYIQPDANLISAYDLRSFLRSAPDVSLSFHNWTSIISAEHNLALSRASNAEYLEWPVIDNPFFSETLYHFAGSSLLSIEESHDCILSLFTQSNLLETV